MPTSTTGMPTQDDCDIVKDCELALLRGAVRGDRTSATLLLHKDFHELGASGAVWDRESILDMMEAEAADGPVTPIAFTTAATDEIREVLLTTRCPTIDFFELHVTRVEEIFGVPAARIAAQLHGVGDVQRYNARMAAIDSASSRLE